MKMRQKGLLLDHSHTWLVQLGTVIYNMYLFIDETGSLFRTNYSHMSLVYREALKVGICMKVSEAKKEAKELTVHANQSHATIAMNPQNPHSVGKTIV
jgi:hypothetical protein